MARTDNLGNWASDVADTIRSKTGKTDKIPLSKFDIEIAGIKTDPVLQDKTLEITENGTTNIVADDGYDGLGNVDVVVNVQPISENLQYINSMQSGTIIGTPPTYLNTVNKNRGSYIGFDIKIKPGETYTISGQPQYEYRVLQVDETTANSMKNGETLPDEMFIADTGYMSTHNFEVTAVDNAAYLWCMCRHPNNYEAIVNLDEAVPVLIFGGEENITEDLTEELSDYGTKLNEQDISINTIMEALQSKGISVPVVVEDYIQDGLIALFDGTDTPNENGYWESRIGNDYIYPKYGAVTTNSSNPLPHTEDSYTNNKVYNLISTGNYLKKGYTIEVVGKLNTAGWLLTMNAAGTPGIGVNTVSETEGCVIFMNDGSHQTTEWSGYLGKRFGATLHLNDVPDRADSLTGTKDNSNVTKYWSGSVNGSPLKTIVNTIAGFHYKAAVTPVLNYYADSNAESNRYNGEICCIRVYNRKLTDEEIAYNHEIDKILFIENDRDIAYINEGDSSIYIQEEEPESKNGIWLQTDNKSGSDTYYMRYENRIYPSVVSSTTYPISTYGHGGAAVGKYIYVFGGLNSSYTKINNAYKYDIVEDKFTALPTPPFYRHVPLVVAVNTDVYIIGGTGGTSPTTPESKLNWVHKYDTLTNTYTRVADLPYSAHNIKGVAVGTDIYIFGGNTSGSTNHAYKYDTLTNTYTKLTNTPYVMAGEHVVADNEYVYIFGGGKNNDKLGLLKYSIANDNYEFIQTDFAALGNGAVSKYGPYVYSAGGYDGLNGGSSNKIYKYDLRTNTYEEDGTLAVVIANFAYATIDNVLYILGGQTSNGASNYLQKKTLFPYDKPTAIMKTSVWLYENNDKIIKDVPTYIGDGDDWEKVN